MKEVRDPKCVFGRRLVFSREEIEQSCLEALESTNCLPSEAKAIKIDRALEKHLLVNIEYRGDLDEGILGWTEFSGSGKPLRIVISDRDDANGDAHDRRIRSTLAHEGGHALLHPILFMDDGSRQMGLLKGSNENIDFSKKRILCRDEDLIGRTSKGGYDGRWWEWQANQAIGGFLMPRKLVLAALDDLLEKGAVTGVGTVPSGIRAEATERLVETFDVNRAAARVRMDVLFPVGESLQMSF